MERGCRGGESPGGGNGSEAEVVGVGDEFLGDGLEQFRWEFRPVNRREIRPGLGGQRLLRRRKNHRKSLGEDKLEDGKRLMWR